MNRVVGWDNVKGLVFEADPRHTEIIIEQLNLKGAKPVSTPGTKEEGNTTQDCQSELSEQQASQYRAITARCNYITPERPDIAYTVKELSRKMAKPTVGDWQRLKRLGRYLLGKPRLQQIYQWQDVQSILKVFTDADWAGCRETRRSTTGGCATLGKHTLKGWSKTQTLIALSSGESELYAALKASSEALGLAALLKDLGYIVKGEVWGDASAALGIIHRRGLGKMRHIDIGLLWIQQAAAEQRLKYAKVLGKDNPADLYTKFLDATTNESHVRRLDYYFAQGRSSEAPKLHVMYQSVDEYLYGDRQEPCGWVHTLLNYVGTCKSLRRHNGKCGGINCLTVEPRVNRKPKAVKATSNQDLLMQTTVTGHVGTVVRDVHDNKMSNDSGTFTQPWKSRSEWTSQSKEESTIAERKCDGPAATKCCWSDHSRPCTISYVERNWMHYNCEDHLCVKNEQPFESLKKLRTAQTSPLREPSNDTCNEFNSNCTTLGRDGSRFNDDGTWNITKTRYSNKGSGNHNDHQQRTCQLVERELNTPTQKVTTTTNLCEAQFCFEGISHLCSASAINPGLRLRGVQGILIVCTMLTMSK